jgi:predicted DNA-binding transcriptional regulator YafY
MGLALSRAQRLLDLIQLLRRHRRAVSGATMADELGVSLRTLYRDIETLKGQGARIDGEPGLGYVLRPGFMLPPLMFSEEEIDALVLGSRWVAERGDAPLSKAARNALAKIVAVLPDDFKESVEASGLLIGPGAPVAAGDSELASIRQAIRAERKRASPISMRRARRRGARSGRSRSASSTACASSWPGASCGERSGIFAPTGSRR